MQMVTISNTDEKERLIVKQIQLVIDQYKRNEIDRDELKDKLILFAQSSGFIDNQHRKLAWNYLVDQSSSAYSSDQDDIQSQQYYEQIRLDVIRTLKRFPPNYSDSQRSELQDELILLIAKILIRHDELHYYQGYHDITLTFLLVLGDDLCLPIIDSITISHLKYFMEPTMEKTRDFLSYLMPLINCINSECAEYMERGDVGHVIFALPWFITWYSHVLDNLDIILRLYDLFVVSHFLMPIYVAAEIVNYHADQVLEKDCEMSSLHQYLSGLPTEIDRNTWEKIIRRALYLIEHRPPDTLERLNNDWKIKCEHIQRSVHRPIRRSQSGRHLSVSAHQIPRRSSLNISRIVFWGTAITAGSLAIFLWHQSQSIDPTKFMSLGDFLAQLYR